MHKVVRTTFEEEQLRKDEAFLRLTPLERLAQACAVRERMRKTGIDYSFAGKKVRIIKFS